MSVFHWVSGMFSIGVTVLSASGALAQAPSKGSGQGYPNKHIRLVTSEPGGGSDFVARLITPGLSAGLGQQVIVDNRGGSLAPEIVARAAPDGYTVLVSGTTFWLGPLFRKTLVDPVKDFSAVSVLSDSPNILVVHPSVPVRSVKELIALAKAKPGGLNYAGTPGSSSQLAGELFKSVAGVDIVYLPYKGTGLALTDLIGAQVQLMFAVTAAVMPHVKSGKLRALAATSAQPSALVPDMPTMAATLPGFEVGTPYEMFAPLATPAAVVNRLNREVLRVLHQADVKEKLYNAGGEIVGSSPEQLAAKLKSDMARWGKVINDAGLREK